MPTKTPSLRGWPLALASFTCLLGFGLAVADLEHRSMWYDEWLSWNWSQMNPVVMARDTADAGGHPPTYYAFLWAWTRLTGTQHLGMMRYSSALFGVLAVALTYRLGVLWFTDRRAALFAALFVATSSTFIYYMRELRMYTLMVLLVVASWWAFTRFVRGKPHGGLLYGLLLALMAYTWYFTGFVALLQLVVLLVWYPRQVPRLLGVYGAVALAVAPWLPSMLNQIRNDAQYADYGLELPFVGLVGKGAATYRTTWGVFEDFLYQYSNEQPFLVFGLLALGVVIGAARWRERLWWALLVWLLGVPLIFFLGNFITPLYNPRYLLMLVPAMGLTVGLGLADLPGRYQAAFAAGLLLFGVWTYPAAFERPLVPHNDLLGTIAADFTPGDRIWYNLDEGARGSSLFAGPSYYLQLRYTDLQTSDFVWDAPNDFNDPQQVPRVWDVRSIYSEPPATTQAALVEGRALVRTWRFDEYRLRLFAAPPPEPVATFADLLAVRYTPLDLPVRREDTLTLDLWWDVLAAPPLDYSYALHLRPAAGGETAAQQDAALTTTERDPRPTSTWTPGTAPYHMQAAFTVPPGLPAGDYALWLAVYHFQDAPGGLAVTGADVPQQGAFVRVGAVRVAR